MAPDPLPTDTGFVKLAAGIACLFGPIAVAGLAMLWVTLRKLDELDRIEAWREERAARVSGLQAGTKPHVWRAFQICNKQNSKQSGGIM